MIQAGRYNSRNPVMPPQSIGKNAQVQNSMVTEGCVIDGSVEFSMISDGVTVEEGAEILDSILMPGAVVKKVQRSSMLSLARTLLSVRTLRSVQDLKLSRTRTHGALL